MTEFNRSKIVADTIDDLRRVFQAVSDFSREAERITGLSGPQLWAVKAIAESKSIKVSDLAKKMYLKPTTVVGILDRLESQDIVQRIRSKIDRRVVHVELTSSGEKLVKMSPDVAQGLLVKGLEKLSDEKLARMNEVMTEFVTILGVKGIPPQLIMSQEINIAAPKRRGRPKKDIH